MYQSALRSWQFWAAVLLVTLLSSRAVHSQDEEDDEEREKTCQQYLFGLVRKVMIVMPKCITSNNRINLKFAGPMERLTRAYCIVKCLLSELEVLDEIGKLDEVNALFFFQDNIPPHVLPAVVEVAGPCLEMASTLVPAQYYCQSYGPFTQCLVRAFLLGLGPWALDCFGSPMFAGMFGFLQFFVPPLTPQTPGASRRLIMPSANTTLLLERMKELRKQRRLSSPTLINSTGGTGPGNYANFTNATARVSTQPPTIATSTTTAEPSSSVATVTDMVTFEDFTDTDLQLLKDLGEEMQLLAQLVK